MIVALAFIVVAGAVIFLVWRAGRAGRTKAESQQKDRVIEAKKRERAVKPGGKSDAVKRMRRGDI